MLESRVKSIEKQVLAMANSSQKTLRKKWQPRDYSLEQLPGLSDRDCLQLQQCGIATAGELLQKAGSLEQRRSLANQLHVHLRYVNKWLALADLARIPSVGCQYCGLLLHSGIISVVQLAQMPVHRLHQRILRLQVATLQRQDLCPSVEEVAQWIQQARQLAVK